MLDAVRPAMFQHRRTSQKPSDDLYKHFKASFPQLQLNANTKAVAPSTLTDAPDDPAELRYADKRSQEGKQADHSPQDVQEPWSFGNSGLTPSIMDPNSHTFNMFATSMPPYYTPTPGGTSLLYHHQAGDLHTPGLAIGLGTPLSLPTSATALHAGHHHEQALHSAHGHFSEHQQQQPFQHMHPYQMHNQTGFPPHQFTHHSSFEPFEGAVGESPVEDLGMDLNMHHHHHSSQMLFNSHSSHNMALAQVPHPTGDKFRYHVTLNAPTAMIKHTDEIPITYLNKGQAYTLNVIDTQQAPHSGPMRYRTFVRISFEDEQQRLKPAACWQLWKEGRGTNEAHHRGGRLQAVEYVESGHIGATDNPNKPSVELECASFDGFCVQWSPSAGSAECPISVRFNFLSTDFSHSKGVKGIPVRLCTKTEAMHESSGCTFPTGPEVCYGKVKLFRDHGAERKLSNDVAHVKKNIDKLNQQIAQIESGASSGGKRKRSGSMAKLTGLDTRPEKMSKHRRTWSVSSGASNNGRGSAEEDMQVKLLALQDMFSSTRPASVLYLRGAPEDDPDLHPVTISGEIQHLVRNDSAETSGWDRRSSGPGATSSLVSPTPSSRSPLDTRRESVIQQPTPITSVSRMNSSMSDEPQAQSAAEPSDADTKLAPPTFNAQQLASPPDNPVIKIQPQSPNTGSMSAGVETLDVGNTYHPPVEAPVQPIACFYVLLRVVGQTPPDQYHRAVYLYRRTVQDFINAVATKAGIDPKQVVRTIRISNNGLHILFDEDGIQVLREAAGFTAEFKAVEPNADSATATSSDLLSPDDALNFNVPVNTAYELRLLF